MQSWSPDNFYYDMISNQAPNTTPTNAAHHLHHSSNQSGMMVESPVDPSVTKKEESESSSESGIGDETSSSSPPAGKYPKLTEIDCFVLLNSLINENKFQLYVKFWAQKYEPGIPEICHSSKVKYNINFRRTLSSKLFDSELF